MEEYTSPAYYLISPIDDWSTQTICLNRSNFHDNLSLYTTLAHEGYPGHLYQQSWYTLGFISAGL